MTLAFLCDLHLPAERTALQYDVLAWAAATLRAEKPDGVVFAGDACADGRSDEAGIFMRELASVGLPMLVVAGNSDVRSRAERRETLSLLSRADKLPGFRPVIGLNTPDGAITSGDRAALAEVSEQFPVVVLHHNPASLALPSCEWLEWWCARHRALIVCGHRHRPERRVLGKCEVLTLAALDPDKSTACPPAITFITFERDSYKLRRVCYPIPRTAVSDVREHLGLSCYDPAAGLLSCARAGLKYAELRPNAASAPLAELKRAAASWRGAGGRQLSYHLPDVAAKFSDDGSYSVSGADELRQSVERAGELGAERLTMHVPRAAVGSFTEGCNAWLETAELVRRETRGFCLGIENLHMTPGERHGPDRRFGVIAPEVLAWARAAGGGVMLDVGHARNNHPYSRSVTLSCWYRDVGRSAVGYHLHQAVMTEDGIVNHGEITDWYGNLISYASFFREWATGGISRAPCIIEVRRGDPIEAVRAIYRLLSGK